MPVTKLDTGQGKYCTDRRNLSRVLIAAEKARPKPSSSQFAKEKGENLNERCTGAWWSVRCWHPQSCRPMGPQYHLARPVQRTRYSQLSWSHMWRVHSHLLHNVRPPELCNCCLVQDTNTFNPGHSKSDASVPGSWLAYIRAETRHLNAAAKYGTSMSAKHSVLDVRSKSAHLPAIRHNS